jgi:arylsulfatase A-like enzyme
MKLRSVSILLLAMMFFSCQKKEDQLNILMIAIDDMNNWIGVMENKARTPNIDALAGAGILFNNAYSVVPLCNPSRTALMSGLGPGTTGIYDNEKNFRDMPGGKDIVTLPQYLREFGYEAVESGKIYHHPRWGGDEPDPFSDPVSWSIQRKGGIGTPGVELYLDEHGHAKWMEGDWKGIFPENAYVLMRGVWGPVPYENEECGDWQSAQYCADYLMEEHDKPFFLACGIFRPHQAYLAPEKYFDDYPLESIDLPEVPEDDMDDLPDIAPGNSPFFEFIKEKDQWEAAVQGYKASMSFADDCVGHVLDALERSQYRENTIVVLYTDHGYQLGHKNQWSKYRLWQQSTNTPLIFQYPGMKNRGEVCTEAVSLLDLYPTILELANLPQSEVLEGETLVPWLDDPSLKKETPVLITQRKGNHSVVWKNWNLIRYEDGAEELYDHSVDPREYRNLAGDLAYEEIIGKLRATIPSSE